MKTIQDRLADVRKELNAIEAEASRLTSDQPDVQKQIEWLVKNMQYVINNIYELERKQGKGKSYAILAQHSRSHLEVTLKRLETWQQTGNEPEF